MRGFHFSLRWLFGVVSFLALGCGLMIYASPLLSKLTFTAVVTVLLGTVSAAVYGSGDRRAFWGGCAAFGFAYLWMVCGMWQSPDGSNVLRERLVTSDVLMRCYEALPSSQANSAVGGGYPANAYPMGTYGSAGYAGPYGAPNYQVPTVRALPVGPVSPPAVDFSDFVTTGHSLFAILFALSGGAITRRCSSRARVVAARSAEA